MEEVLGVVRPLLTAPPPSSSPAGAEAELALAAAQPSLEIVEETPADDMDLDAPLWEHDPNEGEYVDGGEGVVIEGDLDVEDDK
jgi:hypothetical protein